MSWQGGGASAPQEENNNTLNGVETPSPGEIPSPRCQEVETQSLESQGGGASAPQERHSDIIDGVKTPSPRRSHLPHIDLKDHYQFVTFRTYDSIDDFLKRLSSENISSNIRQYKMDEYLDRSNKGCYLNGDILFLLRNFFMEYDKKLYDLVCFSIMPNHVHLLFKQKVELAKIMHQLKGSSAFQLNKLLQQKGKFWEDGYYDKLIRNEDHFSMTYEYIKYNAVKAGLPDSKERFYGIYG